MTRPLAMSYTCPETLTLGESRGEASRRSTSALTVVCGSATADASSAASGSPVAPGRPESGARFTGHNGFQNGFEYEVTCVVTEADRPRAFAWLVLDDSGGPARPSSSWRYRIDPLPGGGSRVRQRFTHGPGASYLRAAAAKAPDRAAEIIAARRDGLRANMTATLRAMKAAADSSHPTGVGPR